MSTITLTQSSSIYDALRSFAQPPRRWIVITAIALLIAAAAAAIVASRIGARATYVTVPVAQQTLVQTVTASGIVNPQNSISVGTQVSGTISSIGVDFNSKVKKGQVLARLDPSTIQAQVSQSQASLAQAEAQAAQANATAGGGSSAINVAAATARAQQAAVAAAQANVGKLNAALTLAQTTQRRDAALLAEGYVARATVDADNAAVAQDRADVAAAQAAVAQAAAQAEAASATVAQSGNTQAAQAAGAQAASAAIDAARAVVRQDQVNLQHTIITSPVDGTVVSRQVSVGQTVAASLQTPTLFSIAQDLTKMQVDINVGEPDIGNVKAGENVSFSVLAYPNRTFKGTVSQVRINPQTVNNVVTYDVVVLAINGDGALLPGMTANATIDVASAKNALVVPIAALQWKPSAGSSKHAGASSASPWGATGANAGAAVTAQFGTGMLFVENGSRLKRVPVTIAMATATQAAVVPQNGATLQPGDNVVVSSTGGQQRSRSNANGRSPMSGGPSMGGGAMRGVR